MGSFCPAGRKRQAATGASAIAAFRAQCDDFLARMEEAKIMIAASITAKSSNLRIYCALYAQIILTPLESIEADALRDEIELVWYALTPEELLQTNAIVETFPRSRATLAQRAKAKSTP